MESGLQSRHPHRCFAGVACRHMRCCSEIDRFATWSRPVSWVVCREQAIADFPSKWSIIGKSVTAVGRLLCCLHATIGNSSRAVCTRRIRLQGLSSMYMLGHRLPRRMRRGFHTYSRPLWPPEPRILQKAPCRHRSTSPTVVGIPQGIVVAFDGCTIEKRLPQCEASSVCTACIGILGLFESHLYHRDATCTLKAHLFPSTVCQYPRHHSSTTTPWRRSGSVARLLAFALHVSTVPSLSHIFCTVEKFP